MVLTSGETDTTLLPTISCSKVSATVTNHGLKY